MTCPPVLCRFECNRVVTDWRRSRECVATGSRAAQPGGGRHGDDQRAWAVGHSRSRIGTPPSSALIMLEGPLDGPRFSGIVSRQDARTPWTLAQMVAWWWTPRQVGRGAQRNAGQPQVNRAWRVISSFRRQTWARMSAGVGIRRTGRESTLHWPGCSGHPGDSVQTESNQTTLPATVAPTGFGPAGETPGRGAWTIPPKASGRPLHVWLMAASPEA